MAAGAAAIGCGAPEWLRRLRRPRRRSGVRQLLQRDGECSYEVGVSATIDGWDQGRGKEGLRRLPGVRGQRQRQRQEEVCESGECGEGGKLGGRSVYRFNPKPFWDSSGRFCFDFIIGF